MTTPQSAERRLRVVDSKHTCKICDIRRLMECAGADGGLAKGAYAARCHGPYRPGDYIYRAGDPMNCVYAVTSGTVKTEIATDGDDMQVTGFYLHGDLFGVEALGERRHVSDAIALERSWICALPVAELEETCRSHPDALRELFRQLGERSRYAVTHLSASRGLVLEQRVLNFLRDLQHRYRHRRHWGGKEIELTIRKEDIANYLGITPETLSRTLRKLQDAGVIENRRKAFVVLDLPSEPRSALA